LQRFFFAKLAIIRAKRASPFVPSSRMTSFNYNVERAPRNRCITTFVSPLLDSENLSRFVQRAVADARWEQLGPMGMPFPRCERNATFLGILTYCYAMGIYPTRDIVQKLVSDKGGHSLAMMGLNASSLRRFRRGFRTLLAQCLAAVLQASSTQEGDRWMPAAAAMDPETYTAEAERRIALAMDWDGDVEDYARA